MREQKKNNFVFFIHDLVFWQSRGFSGGGLLFWCCHKGKGTTADVSWLSFYDFDLYFDIGYVLYSVCGCSAE